MKVVHIHRSGDSGSLVGAAVSLYRLHQALRQANIGSQILCATQPGASPFVTKFELSKTEYRWISATQSITSKLGLEHAVDPGGRAIKRNPAYTEADIVTFHQIYGVFSYLSLPSLTQNKPSIFVLCDMWGLTGHCSYSQDCERWKTGCGNCPYPDMYPPIKRDRTQWEWKLKNWAYQHSNLAIVAKSKWMAGLAKQSMLNHFPIHYIPNGIDTELYRPRDPEESRSFFEIPPGKKVLMFTAYDLNVSRKGGYLLLEALRNLPASLKSELVLLLVGRNGEDFARLVDIQTVDLGYVSSDLIKSKVYSAADLCLVPTRAENLPNVAIESAACGTPIVSFAVGGVPEIVRPGVSGYLAEPENVQDFRNGIVELLEDEAQRCRLQEGSRALVMAEHPIELQVNRYLELYRQLLNE